MSVVECVRQAGMELVSVELNKRPEVLWQANIQTPDRAKLVFVTAVYDSGVWRDGKARPSFYVFACRKVDRGSARSADPI